MVAGPNVLAAARHVIASRCSEQRRSQSTPQRGDDKEPKQRPVSIRDAAAKYKVSRSAVARAIDQILTKHVPRPLGRPRFLNDDEDAGVVGYVTWMYRNGTPASRKQVEEVCITLRRRRTPEALPPSKNWYGRWLKEHPELSSFVPALPKARKEYDLSEVAHLEAPFVT